MQPLRNGLEAILSNEFDTIDIPCAALVLQGPGIENSLWLIKCAQPLTWMLPSAYVRILILQSVEGKYITLVLQSVTDHHHRRTARSLDDSRLANAIMNPNTVL